ncbi:Cro/Cl family transcriptional regulator [Protaetiibacter sp. SSC-01]|uniref:sugar-binding transcriptional regulator n=1 Tax=Protaetiibacter sp. SSC-01 TaxID=2759943 RepID=UPI00165719EC|nr:sugar-binding domain-containing protein [Protaetiibacter sp. SSC-01]QNO37813.1 Cro/Cl family transcriptional regulator [Protaetiibacter sp. SSC-01]
MPDGTQLHYEVARAYYLDGLSKIEIGERFGVSRFQVAKLLKEAVDTGVVRIELRRPQSELTTTLAAEVAAALGVRQVRIAEAGSDELAPSEVLGRTVMETIQDLIRPGMTVGLSWSRTLDIAAKFMKEPPPCDIVQLAGALQLPGVGSLPQLISRLGDSPGINTWPIHAPLVVDEESTARDLRKQPEIAQALDRADRLDLAVVSLAEWKGGESSVWDKVSRADRELAADAGAVAEISGRLLGADGEPVVTRLDKRIISVRLEQLARTPEVVAVVPSAGRLEAVFAAARAGFVTTFVMGSDLAALIKERADASR